MSKVVSISVPVTVKHLDGSISKYNVLRRHQQLETVHAVIRKPRRKYVGSGEDVCLKELEACMY